MNRANLKKITAAPVACLLVLGGWIPARAWISLEDPVPSLPGSAVPGGAASGAPATGGMDQWQLPDYVGENNQEGLKAYFLGLESFLKNKMARDAGQPVRVKDLAVYQALSHPEALEASQSEIIRRIGPADFERLLQSARLLQRMSRSDPALEAAISGDEPEGAVEAFNSHFDGAMVPRGTAASVSTPVLPAAAPAAAQAGPRPSGLARPQQPPQAQRTVPPFRYVTKDGKKYLELQAGKRVRLMEVGPGGPRAPKVRSVGVDVLEVKVGDKPFLVKLTDDNLDTLATMMEVLSDPDASLTNVMLRGDMGTGKNTLVYTLAGLLGQPVRVMSFHAHTSEKDLRYRTTLGEERAGETSRKHSELYEGAEAGDWVILDEPNKPLQIGILNSLNTILQNRQETLPGEEQPVKASSRFRAIALVNPPNRSYTVQEMPADFIRRFSVIDAGYMKKEDEVAFVMDTVFLEESPAKKAQLKPLVEQLVGLAGDIRSSYQQGHLPRPLSTRGVLAMAWHIKKFPKDFPYFREIFDPVYPTEYLEANEKKLVDEYLKQHNLQGQARPADFKLPDVEIDEARGVARLGNDKWGVVQLPLGSLSAAEIPESYRDIPHLQANLQLWWALMKDRAMGRHSLILGETGTGKTQLTGHFLYALLRLRPEEQTFTRQTRGQDITGKPELKNDATFWPAYPLERAIERDTVWLVDEVTKPEDPGTVSLLNNVLQFGQILLPSGKVLNAGPGFGVVAMGTPARAQYEAQEFSGEVLDRFSTHILKPLPADDEVGLVEDYAKAHGLTVGKPVLVELQKALESLRESYRKGLLPVPPSVQSLFRVVSRLGRFPEAKEDLANIFLNAFPAWEKSHEGTIRQALAGVAQALNLPANAAAAQAVVPNPAPARVPFTTLGDASKAMDEAEVGIAGRFVTVPGGEFEMGSPKGENGHLSDENLHKVKISNAYDLQATQVTQRQYYMVMGDNPSHFKNKRDCDGDYMVMPDGTTMCADHPVESLTEAEEDVFIEKLNGMQTEHTYRRPTEAEWEKAARAGTQTPYWFDAAKIKEHAWYGANSASRTHAVGRDPKHANALGLYDMLGNVLERVQDISAKKYKTGILGKMVTDPLNTAGLYRVARGGSWDRVAVDVRAARRSAFGAGVRMSYVGLRLARSRR